MAAFLKYERKLYRHRNHRTPKHGRRKISFQILDVDFSPVTSNRPQLQRSNSGRAQRRRKVSVLVAVPVESVVRLTPRSSKAVRRCLGARCV